MTNKLYGNTLNPKYPGSLSYLHEELNDDDIIHAEAIRAEEAKKAKEVKEAKNQEERIKEERIKEGRRIADEIKRLMHLSRKKNTTRLRSNYNIKKSKAQQVKTFRNTIRNRILKTITKKHRPAFPRYRFNHLKGKQ